MIDFAFAMPLVCAAVDIATEPAANPAALLTRWEAGIDEWVGALGFTGESILRLTLASFAGGLIGLEREVRGHEAGFRTFLLVSFGAALAMVVSQSLALADWKYSPLVEGAGLQVDPGRIAYGVMTGVGFLGAGTIIQKRGNVRGLTTAAGIWSVAALGLAWGFGLYVVGIFATFALLSALLVLGFVEDYLPQQEERALRIRVPWSIDCDDKLIGLARSHGLNVRHIRMTRRANDEYADIRVVVKYLHRDRYRAFQQEIDNSQGCQLLGVG